MKHVIITDRFLMRELQEDDVTERYLGWFRDPEIKRWINAAARSQTLRELKQYVLNQVKREDVFFWGIFEKKTNLHIGNIKYDPVNFVGGYAIMGILIGDPLYRGSGVAKEALYSSAYWLKKHHGIMQILLGVGDGNLAAIRAYEKTGFVVNNTPHIERTSGVVIMSWQL